MAELASLWRATLGSVFRKAPSHPHGHQHIQCIVVTGVIDQSRRRGIGHGEPDTVAVHLAGDIEQVA